MCSSERISWRWADEDDEQRGQTWWADESEKVRLHFKTGLLYLFIYLFIWGSRLHEYITRLCWVGLRAAYVRQDLNLTPDPVSVIEKPEIVFHLKQDGV